MSGDHAKRSSFLAFLYRTAVGRLLLKAAVAPWVSRVAGAYLSSRASRWLVPHYIKKYEIDLSACKKQTFDSFNDFFIREKAWKLCEAPEALVSPCDGFLSVYQIDRSSRFQIKCCTYSLTSLLRDEELAAEFEGGYAMLFRLEPRHYHRYIYPVDAAVQQEKSIPGVLHTVRPDYYGNIPVYTENSREYTVLEHPKMGKLVQMEVGAMLVGKIHNDSKSGEVRKGEEKGYFEFGGSSILLLLRHGSVRLSGEILSIVNHNVEISIGIGDKVAEIHG